MYLEINSGCFEGAIRLDRGVVIVTPIERAFLFKDMHISRQVLNHIAGGI